jgi:hypothetical protein
VECTNDSQDRINATPIFETLAPPRSVQVQVTEKAGMTLVALTEFLFPPLHVRWTNRYGWPELGTVAVLGGAAGWLSAVVASSRTPIWIALIPAALGAVYLAGIAYVEKGAPTSRGKRRPRTTYWRAMTFRN